MHRRRGRQAQIAMKAKLGSQGREAELGVDGGDEQVAERGDMDNHADNGREREMYEVMTVDKFRQEVVKIAMDFLEGNEINPQREYDRLSSTFDFEELIVGEAVRYLMENRESCSWRGIYRKFNLNRLAKPTVSKIERKFRELVHRDK